MLITTRKSKQACEPRGTRERGLARAGGSVEAQPSALADIWEVSVVGFGELWEENGLSFIPNPVVHPVRVRIYSLSRGVRCE